MRLLISSVPVAGHLMPLLPMATAARATGHDVAVLCSADLWDLVAPFDTLVAGQSIWVQRESTVRRLGRDWTAPGPEAAEMFAGTRVATTFDPALERARAFAPDLVLCDPLDFVGPMIAATLGVPWAAHGISGGLPDFFHDALDRRWATELRRRDLLVPDRIAYVDPYPELLHGNTSVPDRQSVRFPPTNTLARCTGRNRSTSPPCRPCCSPWAPPSPTTAWRASWPARWSTPISTW